MSITIYQNETEIFRNSFLNLRDKGIAIYGIGQRTAMLLPGITDFRIVGLLDRDPANIGKQIGNIEVISMQEAEAKASAIVICSDPSNYQTIYRRIASTKLPVYYANGERAVLQEQNEDYTQHTYWKKSVTEARDEIDKHKVITFDIFDTLIQRKVFLPQDVFRLVSMSSDSSIDFEAERIRAVAEQSSPFFNLSDVYRSLQRSLDLSNSACETLEQAELNTEVKCVLPRKAVVDLLKYALSVGKEVYLISDMYLNRKQIRELLSKAGIIEIPDDHILISCEQKGDKKKGELWRLFTQLPDIQQTLALDIEADSAADSRGILHIGDDPVGDVSMPSRFGIDTYGIWNSREILDHSSLTGLDNHAVSLQSSLMLGLVCGRLLNNPFGLHQSRGKVRVETYQDFGYVVLGPIMLKFLMWLVERAHQNGNQRLLFCARDGWFLTRDLEYVRNILSEDNWNNQLCESRIEGTASEKDCSLEQNLSAGILSGVKYLPASRRMIFITNIHDEAGLEEFARIPFLGTFSEYLHSRFNISADQRTANKNAEEINSSGDPDMLKLLAPYLDEIWAEIHKETSQYNKYLEENGFLDSNDSDAIVDLGFNGTNQYKYSEHLGHGVKGYYFLYNFSENNRYAAKCDAEACFNAGQVNGRDSLVGRKSMFLESFLTAPYGMIRYIDSNGEFVTEEDKTNQKNFDRKIQVNEGIQQFIRDFAEILPLRNFDGEDQFPDFLFSELLSGKCDIAPEVMEAFYFDNDIVGSKELKLEI